MAEILPPRPVKFFVAALFVDESELSAAKHIMTGAWGPLDFEGTDRAFDVSNYYETEMGTHILRRFLSFQAPMSPDELVTVKIRCNQIEEDLSVDGKRTVNLDAGYLDHNKIILASAKEEGQKIYLGQGIYADLMGRFGAGHYQPFDWTFPDYRDGRYDEELRKVRMLLLRQLREMEGGG
jgi:hypothetical protein